MSHFCNGSATKLLVACNFGNPRQRGVWSSTPYHICQELDSRGLDYHPLDTQTFASPTIMRAVKGISKLYYANSYQHYRGMILRWCRSRHAANWMDRGYSHVLHLGAGHLPLISAAGNQKHFLYLDSTFHSWSTSSTKAGLWHRRLAKDTNSAEQRAYDQMDRIFTIGEYLIEDLVQHYHIPKEKVTPVGTGPGGISPYTGKKDYSIPTVLFVAKARFEDKGGDLLLRAFKLAKKSLPKLRLIIVGQELDHFDKIDGLEIYGHVPFDQLKAFFAQSALFAMPALNEPWGLVYLEAMLSKMPILGLRRNAIPEFTLNGQVGFMAEKPTPESVAETLVEAFRDTERLSKMGEMAQANVRNRYTWAHTVDSMLAHMQLAQC